MSLEDLKTPKTVVEIQSSVAAAKVKIEKA